MQPDVCLTGCSKCCPRTKYLAGLKAGKAWFSRRDIDTLAEPQAALRGREIVFLADPVQALILQNRFLGGCE